MTRSKNWGGVRPGAGPKRSLKPPLKKTAVTLEQWQVDTLRAYGDGSVSAGVRRLANEKWEPKAPVLHHVSPPDGDTLQIMSREDHEKLHR